MRPREWVGTACGQQLRDLEPLPTITIECHSASAFDFHKKGFFEKNGFILRAFRGTPLLSLVEVDLE